ncbi:MAG: NAD(P)H-binding protein [Bifidobacteriaceae bacterium]|jgi:putative NADH-flavin reductase|nr:NAD(P)H-binding protein [Bifidobacteriaceae bacterium]
MRIVILGANGQVGKVLAGEALSRGHMVLGVTRQTRPTVLDHGRAFHVRGDARSPELARAVASRADVVINALRPPEGQESDLVPLTMAIHRACADLGVRLVVSGGAACLRADDRADAPRVIDTHHVQAAWRAIAQASADQWDALMAADPVGNWVYIAPPASLIDGPRFGAVRKSADVLVTDGEGRSRLSWADYCALIMEEVEAPSGHRRLTGGYS